MIYLLRETILQTEVLERDANLFVRFTEELVDAVRPVWVVARMPRGCERAVLAAGAAIDVVALRLAARRRSTFYGIV